MPGQERLKDRFTNKFNHLLHSLAPRRSKSLSPNGPNRPITPTVDSQASSTPVGPDPTSIHGIPDIQPLNSPSMSNIYPSTVIDPAGDEVPGRMAIEPTLDPQASSTPVGPDPTSIHGIPNTQPLNSPSLSNIYPSIVINPAGDEAPGRMAELASAGFQGVKTTLQLIERTTDVFPPLKSTVAGLLGVVDIVEVCDFQLSVVI
jgi:hypothetical protein